MATEKEKESEKHEITVLETTHCRDSKGKMLLDLVAEEIQRLLWSKIHPKNGNRLYYTEVQGHVRLFQTYNSGSELGLHGGQISIFSFTTPQKEKGEGIITGINSGDPEEQGEMFWRIMDPEKGLIMVHFVHWEGPGQKDMPTFGSKPVYDGSEMTAYRISFWLQRKVDTRIILLYNLKIDKEQWGRTAKQEIVSL